MTRPYSFVKILVYLGACHTHESFPLSCEINYLSSLKKQPNVKNYPSSPKSIFCVLFL